MGCLFRKEPKETLKTRNRAQRNPKPVKPKDNRKEVPSKWDTFSVSSLCHCHAGFGASSPALSAAPSAGCVWASLVSGFFGLGFLSLTSEAQRQPQRSPYSKWDTFSVPSLCHCKALPAEAKAKAVGKKYTFKKSRKKPGKKTS